VNQRGREWEEKESRSAALRKEKKKKGGEEKQRAVGNIVDLGEKKEAFEGYGERGDVGPCRTSKEKILRREEVTGMGLGDKKEKKPGSTSPYIRNF